MARRTLNAKELAKAIKDGMAYEEIKATYRLSDQNMEKVTAQLLQHSMIGNDDLNRMTGVMSGDNKEPIQPNAEPVRKKMLPKETPSSQESSGQSESITAHESKAAGHGIFLWRFGPYVAIIAVAYCLSIFLGLYLLLVLLAFRSGVVSKALEKMRDVHPEKSGEDTAKTERTWKTILISPLADFLKGGRRLGSRLRHDGFTAILSPKTDAPQVSPEVDFAFLISVLVCASWPHIGYIWVLILTPPLIALFHGIKNWETNINSSYNISKKIQVGTLIVMIMVLALSKYEDYELEKEIAPVMNEYKQSYQYKDWMRCRETCKEVYGFQIRKPSTWHLFGNKPLEGCEAECYQRHLEGR